MSHKVRRQALGYLGQCRIMTLATTGPQGVWAAAVFYVNDEFDLFFLSAGHTRHAQNMQAHPRVAAAIQADYTDWTTIQGIQLEGIVSQLQGSAKETAVTRYQARYPFVAGGDTEIQAALNKVNWYCLRPDRLYFIDNSKGLGHRDEVIQVV